MATTAKLSKRMTAHAWIVAHVDFKGDDCLYWPYMRNPETGYPYFGIGEKVYRAHRFMCRLAHGEPSDPKLHAAHSCGNGKKGCMNPRHLSWKTASENMLDKNKHGTMPYQFWGNRGKLTAEQIQKIRALKGKKTQFEIGRMFGINATHVGRIHAGKSGNEILARAARG